MTPSQRARYGCEAARNPKWRIAAPPVPLMKRAGGAPQPWPIHPHPTRQVHRSHFLPPPPPPPHLPLFHTRHAEESAEKPHLVTIIRPCGQSTLRKITVLLNRRGVVSFEQLLLDISEALGFPRWHRARVTRLYTTHAREVKGVCDFFRGEVAFLALGKARPELSGVQEALEELFPEHSHYRADALRAWEKRLCPAPDKATKADSGYSEGTDSSKAQTNQEIHQDTNTHVKNNTNTYPSTQLPHHIGTHQPENYDSEVQKCHKKNSCRKPTQLPNHLQRLRVRVGVRERQLSVIGPFKHEEGLREADITSPALCEDCLARRVKHQCPERLNLLSGRVPLPPVSRKQKGSSYTETEVRKLHVNISPPLLQPISRDEEKSVAQLLSNPLRDVGRVHKDIQQRTSFDLPSEKSDVPLADIERRYEIGRVVGDGNFAVVRECRDRDNGQTLAVKIVERSKLIGREHMMQNELSLLGSLCHPRIVRLFAHHHTHTHSYLVMELVSGGDLFEAVSERGKFPEAEAGLMVSDVSEALNYIHCKSIVHRDLKPENLLIEHVAAGICRLKLGDFGLAMVVTEPVFTICGTPTYVAPEILYETGYGVAVDVWALGVILYILLSGFPPFRSRDRDQEELFQLIKQGQLHFLSPYWDPISEEARGLVSALLQPDPTVRLTAEQTLLHPWVKAMASICRQRALTDKTQRDTADTGAEPDKSRQVQRLAQTNAAETTTDTIPGHTNLEGEVTHKEFNRHDERQTEMNTERGQDENKPLRQQSRETSIVHTISPQLQVHTPSVATPGQQKPECISACSSSPNREPSMPEMQDPGPPDCDLGSPVSPSVELNPLGAPSAQSEFPSQIKTENSQQQLPTYSPTSTNTVQRTTAGNLTEHHPSLNPAAPSSSSHSLHQQNCTSPLRNSTTATAQNHPSENYDKPNAYTTATHPPTQS
ncbi:serine/threonine-protein kinase DCLK1 isoform X1 [Sander lucioperca]|uniref:serine/threonine-protein kinase DCLK1 isoform X1 n=1 Tax=Sander lucioperca TaxID=283035 RepID=UPI00125E8BE8|nr:serine/threonine-protein kinase DCLK1 isoform X1 [Sander lucioperca]